MSTHSSSLLSSFYTCPLDTVVTFVRATINSVQVVTCVKVPDLKMEWR